MVTILGCFALLSLPGSARASVVPDLLGEEIPTWSVEKIFSPGQQAEEDGLHVTRRRYVTVNLDPLREMAKTGEPMVINLNMFQDDQATLTMEYRQDESSGIHLWTGGNSTTGVRARLRFMKRSGSLSGSSASEDDFSDGWIRGSVHLGLNHQVYFLRAIQSVPGMIAVDHWDPAGVIPTDHGPHGGAEPREPPVDYIPDENEGFAGNSEITRLILYSDSALQTLGGLGGVESYEFDTRGYINQGFAYLQQPFRVKDAGVDRYPTGIVAKRLKDAVDLQQWHDGFLRNVVHDLRKGYGADYVEILVGPGDPMWQAGGDLNGFCGATEGLNPTNEPIDELLAFVAIAMTPVETCNEVGYTSFHELGHQLGACHEGTCAGFRDDNYPFLGDADNPNQTIMKELPNATVPYYSIREDITWMGNIVGTDSAENAVVVGERAPIMANFEGGPDSKTITVAFRSEPDTDVTSGRVISVDSSAIDCTWSDGSTSATGCDTELFRGEIIGLRLIVGNGSFLRRWEGCSEDDETAAEIQVYASSNRLCTAVLGEAGGILEVRKFGLGEGLLQSSEPGIMCGEGCVEQSAGFDVGDTIDLTASQSEGSEFGGWAGDCSGMDPSYPVDIIEGRRECEATFVQEGGSDRLLVVSRIGGGVGTISAVGIECGSDCSESYDVDEPVDLEVFPGPDSVFDGWGVDCADFGDEPTITLVMDDNKQCTARFEIEGRDLAVTLRGSGLGTMESVTEPQYECDSDCGSETWRYEVGEEVVVRATAEAPDSGFSQWTGDCQEAQTTPEHLAVVEMDADRDCSAWFEPIGGVPLTLSVGGPGSDGSSIDVTPGENQCVGGGACDVENYLPGTSLTLTATPADEYRRFVQWGGSCSSGPGDDENPKSMVIDVPTTCSAIFGCVPGAPATECPGD